jgi:hypothetical protein
LVLIAAFQAPLIVEHGRNHRHFLCGRQALEIVAVAGIGIVPKPDNSNECVSVRLHRLCLRSSVKRALPVRGKKKKTSPKRGLKI